MSKRARRQTVRRGLSGKQRRRLQRELRRIEERGETYVRPTSGYGVRVRDAQRLHEAGLACAVASKTRPWMRYPVAEITLFADRASALRRYPSWAIMSRRAR